MGKISSYIIGIAIFTFFIASGMYMMMELKASDSTFADDPEFDSFNSTFNQYDDLNTQVDEIETGIVDAEPNWGVFGALNALVETGWQTLKTLFASFSFMNTVFNGLTTIFGVPAYIPGLIIMIVTVVIAFAIFGAIFQRDI